MKHIRIYCVAVVLIVLATSLFFVTKASNPEPQPYALSISLVSHQQPVISHHVLKLGAPLRDAQDFFGENGSTSGNNLTTFQRGSVYVYHMKGIDGIEHIYNLSFAIPKRCDQFRPSVSTLRKSRYGNFAQEFHADSLAKIFPVSSWNVVAGTAPFGDYTQQQSTTGCTLYIGDVA